MPAYLSLKDHVYNYISNEIKEGRLKPNEKINEKNIATALQISNTPVREAFIELSVYGVLENIPRKGFFVKAVPENKVRELYQIIGTLDSLSASLAMATLDSSDYDRLHKLTDDMDTAIDALDYNRYYELQSDFHHVYIDKCGNEELAETIKNLKKRFIRQSYEDIDDDKLVKILIDTNNEHKSILKLMADGKSSELDIYIRETHWGSANSIFDIFT